MSYEFTELNGFNSLLDQLSLIGQSYELDAETYGVDDDLDVHGIYGNDMSFDSMSTFDENDMDYQRSLMY